jgi:hypothetical protein
VGGEAHIGERTPMQTDFAAGCPDTLIFAIIEEE